MNVDRAGKSLEYIFSASFSHLWNLSVWKTTHWLQFTVSDFSAVEVNFLVWMNCLLSLLEWKQYFWRWFISFFQWNLDTAKELSWIQASFRTVQTADCYVLPVACWMSIGQFLFHMYINIARMLKSWYELSSHNFPLVWGAGDFWERKGTSTVSDCVVPSL